MGKSSMSFRDVLLKNGVSPRDIREAVEDARDVVRKVNQWAGVGHRALASLASSKKLGNKTRSVVVLGAKALNVLELGAGSKLESGGRVKR
jgi:uncharacterized protein (UPF0147 family)